jgi:L-lactate dehydrogenase complex protein LldF
VKIDIHEQLYRWRQVVAAAGHVTVGKRWAMKVGGWVLRRPRRLRWAGAWGRRLLRLAPAGLLRRLPWGRRRDWPEPATSTFQEWYRNRRDSR